MPLPMSSGQAVSAATPTTRPRIDLAALQQHLRARPGRARRGPRAARAAARLGRQRTASSTACSAVTRSGWRSTCWTTSRPWRGPRSSSWRGSRACATTRAPRRSPGASSTRTARQTMPYCHDSSSSGASPTTAPWTARRSGSTCWRPTPHATATTSWRARSTDRLGRRVTLLDSLLAALGWILGRLDDPAGGGYLWVRGRSPDGIANQVWEDSGDSYYHADGTLFDFTRPYAPVAVQGYAYDALLGAATCLEQLAPVIGRAAEPAPSAPGRRLRARTPARLLAAGPRDVRPGADVRQRTGRPPAGRARPVSRRAQGTSWRAACWTATMCAPIRERLIRRLFEADLLAGAGIRTRSTARPGFGPAAITTARSGRWTPA